MQLLTSLFLELEGSLAESVSARVSRPGEGDLPLAGESAFAELLASRHAGSEGLESGLWTVLAAPGGERQSPLAPPAGVTPLALAASWQQSGDEPAPEDGSSLPPGGLPLPPLTPATALRARTAGTLEESRESGEPLGHNSGDPLGGELPAGDEAAPTFSGNPALPGAAVFEAQQEAVAPVRLPGGADGDDPAAQLQDSAVRRAGRVSAEVQTLELRPGDGPQRADVPARHTEAAAGTVQGPSMPPGAGTLAAHAPTSELAPDPGSARETGGGRGEVMAAVSAATADPAAGRVREAAAPTAGPSRADGDAPTLQAPFGRPGWSDAVGQRILWLGNRGGGVAEMTLNPPELGQLQVRVSTQNEQTSVVFTSAQPSVREALDLAMPRLRELFESQGLQLVDVDVRDQSRDPRREAAATPHRGAGGYGSDPSPAVAEVAQATRVAGLIDDYA